MHNTIINLFSEMPSLCLGNLEYIIRLVTSNKWAQTVRVIYQKNFLSRVKKGLGWSETGLLKRVWLLQQLNEWSTKVKMSIISIVFMNAS